MSTDDTIPEPTLAEGEPTPSQTAPVSEVEDEEDPRITNEKGVGKKHREALKRLSKFNDEVRVRKAGESSEAADPDEPIAPPPGDEIEVQPPPLEYQVMSTGNIIAAIGVGVAALCLYLSYTPPRPPPRQPPRQPPRPPPSSPEPPAQRAPTPRFRRL